MMLGKYDEEKPVVVNCRSAPKTIYRWFSPGIVSPPGKEQLAATKEGE